MSEDTISRQAAIDHLKKRLYETALNNNTEHPYYEEIADNRVDIWLNELPPAQPEKRTEERTETHACDCISRQSAIDIVQGYAEQLQGYIGMPNDSEVYAYARGLLLSIDRNIKALLSAQAEVLACGEGELTAQTTGAPLHDSGSDYAHGFADGYKQGLKDAESERVRCKDCLYWVAHDKRCVYLNHGFAPNMWCCHGRRADG